ncbi:hypothetical protein YEP4_07093 [Yersinia enterocolitica subsp. palearctica YE-P4]|nr:hypothetical protein IOK_19841 [Yersinia enterocolitica subsp. palearctica PhRBD_Ye1]EOR68468.1 hypothetical protein YE149_07163 [Yersinia enterocolitica subsp. palearctica YE-149]EOR78034.1 hypothetical protein YEP1_07178 [Yersinia enterocolitica subsp. palearctica YE-P1]EOR82560.1 hypothetical protein YEP4_07093 [Yersinia enterocolitica subsp. palearctica YE-P4]
MARLEPSGPLIFTKGIRRLYDLPVFTAAGTLSITSAFGLGWFPP